jgi:carbonic anhydrase/acetyltransferase-like protein (isoleucine patch superfamily)
VLHGCTIGDRCLIGMQATILDDAVIGDGCLIAAGALVTQETRIPPGSLVLGSPARVVRSISEEGQAFHRELAAKYARLKENYLRDALRGG